MMIFDEILKKKTNEELLEEHRLFSISAWEEQESIGYDATLFDIQQEILSRMIPDELR